MMKIAFLGKMASGKTELSEYFLETYGGNRVAFADTLKKDVIDFGFTPDGNIVKSRDRELLQNYGQLRRGELSELQVSDDITLENHNDEFIMIDHKNNLTMKLGKSYTNYWVDQTISRTKFLAQANNVIIDDIRRANEAEALKQIGFTIVKINTSDEVRMRRLIKRDGDFNKKNLNNISETEVDKIPFDYELNNNYDDNNGKNELDKIVSIILK
jgi:dephospho-CoA kinase